MENAIKVHASEIISTESKAITGIITFTQTPSKNQFDDHQSIKNEICACDLFSYFTANIIKEEIIFTR